MSGYPYAAPGAQGVQYAASAGYGAPASHHSPYGPPAPALAPSQGGGAYTHSPYTTPAPAPTSNYGSPVTAHSPYAGSTLSPTSTLVAGASGYPSTVPSPRMGMMGLGGAQPAAIGLSSPLPAGVQLNPGPGAASPPQQAQPFASNVVPGTVTYTTTVDEKGRTVYHHFRAESATYTSPQGMTYTGIQWLPIETSYNPQVGVAPAGPDIAAAVRPLIAQGASPPPVQYEKSYKEEKEERRRKREERKAAERQAAWEAERIARERAEEEEIMRARERDATTDKKRRSRRLSMGAGLGADLTAPTDYGRERSRERGGAETMRERELRERVAELEGRMSGMSVGGRGADPYGAPPVGARSRRNSTIVSPYDEPVGAGAYDREYDREPTYAAARSRPSSIYGGVSGQNKREPVGAGGYDREYDREPTYAAARSRPSSIYGGASGQNKRSSIYADPGLASGGIYSMPNPERSPRYGGSNQLPPAAGGVYPPGHIYEGRPMQGGIAPPSPSMPPVAPYGMGAPSPHIRAGAMPAVSPRMGGTAALAGGFGMAPPAAQPPDQLLTSPEAFSRPINRAQAFTPFTMLKINDLDDFLDDRVAARPPVLGTHDVLPEDWGRFMNDIALAWKNLLPLPAFTGGAPPVKTDLVIDLLDLWNQQFFIPRHAEIALYRGRHCLSGRQEGVKLPDALIPSFEDSDLSSEGSDSDSGLDRHGPGAYGYGGGYGGGRGGAAQREAKRKAKMEEKVRRAMEKKEDFRKGYALYLHYLPPKDY